MKKSFRENYKNGDKINIEKVARENSCTGITKATTHNTQQLSIATEYDLSIWSINHFIGMGLSLASAAACVISQSVRQSTSS
jgi:hypothetical protein